MLSDAFAAVRAEVGSVKREYHARLNISRGFVNMEDTNTMRDVGSILKSLFKLHYQGEHHASVRCHCFQAELDRSTL